MDAASGLGTAFFDFSPHLEVRAKKSKNAIGLIWVAPENVLQYGIFSRPGPRVAMNPPAGGGSMTVNDRPAFEAIPQ
jgi:hypothetical protein